MRWLILVMIGLVLIGCGMQQTSTQTTSDMAAEASTPQAMEMPDAPAAIVTAVPAMQDVPPPGGLSVPQPAPELMNEVWLNSAPLTLAGLREEHQVTLVEFWTYGCYNCRNVLPALRSWHEQYSDKGLTIVGVHYPEFSYEHELENVQQAVTDLDIAYPVAIDNDGKTWKAYRQRAWPTLYLVDKQGDIRYVHVGEGAYDTTEQWIRYLIAQE